MIQDTLQVPRSEPPGTISALGWPGIIALGLLLLLGLWLWFIHKGGGASGPDDTGAD